MQCPKNTAGKIHEKLTLIISEKWMGLWVQKQRGTSMITLLHTVQLNGVFLPFALAGSGMFVFTT